jgi:hypothetical protein
MHPRLLALVLIALLVAAPASAQAACSRANCIYLPGITRPEPLRNVTPPAAADALQVRSVTVKRSSTSSLRLEGEIVNATPVPVYSVQVTARFLDDAGQLAATNDAYAMLSRIDPGQRSPFRLSLSNPPATLASYSLGLDGNDSSILDYRQAQIVSSSVRDNFGVEVFGDVRNPEASELRSVEVVIAFYDGAGNVVAVDNGFASPSSLAGGVTAPYRVSTFEQFTYATMHVQAEGYLAP